VSKLVGQQLRDSPRAALRSNFPDCFVANVFHRLKDPQNLAKRFFLMQMFAWIKLRCGQAFLARNAQRIGLFGRRRQDVLQSVASLKRQGGADKRVKRNSLAFPVYFFEGPALGRHVRLLIRDVVMYFCFASSLLRNNLNSTLSRRF
jgi:hypothetical protein